MLGCGSDRQVMSSVPAEQIAAADAALNQAARTAQRYLLSPLLFLRSVSGIERVVEAYHRALFVIERRSAVVRYGPASAEETPAALPDVARVELWQGTPAQIAATSRVTVVCADCRGRGEVPCPDLARKRHEPCSDCVGTGRRVAGVRGDKKCIRCRGTGMLGCRTCEGGVFMCRACGNSGLRSAWIEVHTEERLQVTAERSHPLAQAHPRLLNATDFKDGPWPHRLLSDERFSGKPTGWPEMLAPVLDPRTERVRSTQLQVFGATRFRIRYASAMGQGVLCFDERGNGPLKESTWQPLIWRSRLVMGAAGVCALAAIVVTLRFVAQHAWFDRFGHGGWGLLLGLLAAPLVAAAVAEGLLPKPARRPRWLAVPSMLAGALWLAIGLLFTLDQPSSVRAEAALRQGDLERAGMEAEALHLFQRETDSSKRVLDAVHSQRFAAADTLEQRIELAAATWSSAELRDQAWESVRRDCEQLIERAALAHDAKRLVQIQLLTQTHLPLLAQRASLQASLVRAADCLQSLDIDCALREEQAARVNGVAPGALDAPREHARTELQGQLAMELKTSRVSKNPVERHVALTKALKVAEQLAALTGQESEPSRAHLLQKLKRAASHREHKDRR